MPFPALPIRSPLARRLIAATVAAVIPLTAVACGSDSTDDASATRTYDSDFGPVEIPANPEDIQRIVSVDFYTPAALVDPGSPRSASSSPTSTTVPPSRSTTGPRSPTAARPPSGSTTNWMSKRCPRQIPT